MSEKDESVDSNQNDEKIKVYDNDDAYLFGDASLNESNEYEEKEKNEIYNDIDDNNNNLVSPNQLSNKLIQDEELFLENEKNNFETPQNNKKEMQKINTDINYEMNDININNENEMNQNDEDNNNFNNLNSPEPETNSKEDPLNNEKYMINEITTDMENENENENEQEYEENNKLNNNNNNSKNVIKNKNNNYQKIQNETEDNNTNQQDEKDNENESNESEVPLITLNFLSICQCCKNQFNSTKNIPYLFKCGHFFCKQCIEEQFTDDEGIKCPNDGLVGKYLSELKILNNFITDKPASQRTNSNKKFCEYHKGQTLTHYIEDTKELICVYCAFDRFKSNPGVEIKDINEKCRSMENKIDNIIDDNQHNVEIIQSSLRDIKKNKENEEKKINDVFNELIETVKIKRDELLSKIDKLFTENAKKLSNKLEIFSNKLEKSESIKNQILSFQNNQEEINFSQIIDIYDSFIKELNDLNKISLQKYKFIYNDELTIKGIINKFGALELTEKNYDFLGQIPQINIKEEINGSKINMNMNNKNEFENQMFIKVNKDMNNNNINHNNSYKIDNFYHFINNKEKSMINDSSILSNKSQKNKANISNIYNINNQKTSMSFNINSAVQNSNDKYKSQNHTNVYISNNIKPSSSIKINNVHNNINKKTINKNNKSKITKKYINNNKRGLLLDVTSPTYGNSMSKIENHGTFGGIRVNTPKSLIKKFNYNLSIGQNCSFNNMPSISSLSNNQKINNKKSVTRTKNKSKSKNNKSITAPARTNLKTDNY